ncbi:MAG TPA: hypothetical protein VJS89_00730 [Gammaproteobacteria bacterium]|nr:hypothetical protein [Gammaproteobacteria bacterium]
MSRKLNAVLLALTGLLIALGAFGHSFLGRKTLDTGLARVALDAHTDKLVYLVWYFCGGCMLVFGLLVIAGACRAWRGENRWLPVAALIGIFYLLVGALSLAYMREPFWSVFVILGGLTLIFSFMLRKA